MTEFRAYVSHPCNRTQSSRSTTNAFSSTAKSNTHNVLYCTWVDNHTVDSNIVALTHPCTLMLFIVSTTNFVLRRRKKYSRSRISYTFIHANDRLIMCLLNSFYAAVLVALLLPLLSHSFLSSTTINTIFSREELPQTSCEGVSSSRLFSQETATASTESKNTKRSSGGRTIIPTHRSAAIFAYMESMKKAKASTFAIRKMENDPNYQKLDRRDRAFARRILATAERRQGQIDKVINKFRKKDVGQQEKNSAVERLCEATLRIGAAQLLFLDTPSYAVLSETVEVLRMHPKIRISKPRINFVNAMLRSIDRDGLEALNDTSIFDNFEPTLIEEWIKAYGEDTTKIIMEASMEQSPIFISVNQRTGNFLKDDNGSGKSRTKIQTIAKEFQSLIAGENYTNHKDYDNEKAFSTEILPQGSIMIPKQFMGQVKRWPLYEDGDWWVQDPSATLPAIALFNGLCRYNKDDKKPIASLKTKPTTSRKKSNADSILGPIFKKNDCDAAAGAAADSSSSRPGDMHVVDLCSAPGGKTIQLCSLGFGKVTAVEMSPNRIKPLKENLNRLNMEEFCDVVVADGREWVPPNKIQGVLVDVPCSATGVGARRPDVLRKSPPDLDELLVVQRELAAHAADSIIEPGGMMVYATCSLLKQESEDQVNWLLSRGDSDDDGGGGVANMETVPILPGEIPGFDDAIDDNGWLRVLPGVLPGSLSFCDGFFVARLRRTL